MALPIPYVTPEEYLHRERVAAEKSEYIDGQVYAMAGANAPHNLIAGNTLAALHAVFRGRGCRVFNSDMKVLVDDTGLFTYPDVSALCGTPEYLDATQDVLVNPTLIVEVLSPSTESYDRGAKFRNYRRLPSLQEYVLISQKRVLLERYVRQPSGDWLLTEFRSLGDVVELPSVQATLPLSEVYAEIDVEPEPLREGLT